jgi:hypothetical protein
MAEAAIRVGERMLVPGNLGKWRYTLPQHFFEKGRRTLAIRIAEATHRLEPHNRLSLTNLATLYRAAGDPARAERLFSDFPIHAAADRAFYVEWGTSAGSCGHDVDAALLQAFSLSDQADYRAVDNECAKRALAGMGAAFSNMLESFNDPRILAGLAAVPVLGTQLRLDSTASNHFARHSQQAEKLGSPTPTAQQAWQWFLDARLAAACLGVSSEVLDRVGDPGRLTFSQLEFLTRAKGL